MKERRMVRMKSSKRVLSAAAFLVFAAALTSCMTGIQLTTSAADPAAVTGTYTLLLYGCHYPDDAQNVAFLVSDSSKYPLEIFDLDTSYKVKTNVPAQQALQEANSFLKCTTYRLWQTKLERIPDDSGGTIGYEVRPLYLPWEFGKSDIMLISYSLRDGKARVYIKLDPDVERAIEASGGSSGSGNGK
jgi:hypothetical protein